MAPLLSRYRVGVLSGIDVEVLGGSNSMCYPLANCSIHIRSRDACLVETYLASELYCDNVATYPIYRATGIEEDDSGCRFSCIRALCPVKIGIFREVLDCLVWFDVSFVVHTSTADAFKVLQNYFCSMKLGTVSVWRGRSRRPTMNVISGCLVSAKYRRDPTILWYEDISAEDSIYFAMPVLRSNASIWGVSMRLQS